MEDGRIPVTMITGFLGAGKNFLNQIMHHQSGLRDDVAANVISENIV